MGRGEIVERAVLSCAHLCELSMPIGELSADAQTPPFSPMQLCVETLKTQDAQKLTKTGKSK